jgi:hypothetical protein
MLFDGFVSVFLLTILRQDTEYASCHLYLVELATNVATLATTPRSAPQLSDFAITVRI